MGADVAAFPDAAAYLVVPHLRDAFGLAIDHCRSLRRVLLYWLVQFLAFPLEDQPADPKGEDNKEFKKCEGPVWHEGVRLVLQKNQSGYVAPGGV